MTPSPYARSRRASNELSACVQIEQLRTLQHQLANMIQDARAPSDDEDSTVAGSVLDESARSAASRGMDISERAALLGNGAHDIESGATYKPQRKSALLPSSIGDDKEDKLPVTHRTGTTSKPQRNSALLPSSIGDDKEDKLPVTYRTGTSKPLARKEITFAAPPVTTRTFSEISDDRSTISADPTVTTGGSQADRGRSQDDADASAQSPGALSRRRSSRWSRSPARSISRSIGRRRSSNGEVKRSTPDKLDVSLRESIMGMGKSMKRLPNYDFLQRDEDKDEGSLRPGAKWWHGVFFFSLISMLACIITLWAPYPIGARMPTAIVAAMPWSDGCRGGLKSCICPRETICADDLLSMIFLTVARSTAWFDYPLYMLLFMSKANNLNNFLQKTALRCWINFSDYHKVHSLFGIIVGFESTSHSFFHILRWARRREDIQLLWNSRTGLTGLIAITLCPLIVLPMTVPYIKSRMHFEWRKGLHYLSLVWGAALMCHAPQRIFWLIGIPFFIYLADKMAEGLFKTHLVESAHFQRLGDTSCIISFENPPDFGKQNSAYIYLMLPWLSKYQFHAFTVFPCSTPNHSSVCIHKCGDWTQSLMKTISTPTHKPAFVVGPFLSPFSSPAMDSENLVAVASGIGVTPAISLIKQYSRTSRRLNLVWICRDAGLVEHFLQNVEFSSDGYTLIYYTGKERGLILRDDLPPNVFMFNGRPNLNRAIGGIISSIATGEGLPEELSGKVLTQTPVEIRSRLLLEKALSIYTMDQLFDHTVKASNYHNEGLEPLIDLVNYRGVASTMRHLLGEDSELVSDKITSNFEIVDLDGDCRLDRDGFESFFNHMIGGPDVDQSSSLVNVKRELKRMNTCRDMFGSGRIKSQSERKDEFGIKTHLHGDGKFSAKNWNMLYCGGSQPVLDQLKAFKREFGIDLSVEKFDW